MRNSSDSDKMKNIEETKEPKKRIMKMNRKNLEYFNETNGHKEERRNRRAAYHNGNYPLKLFKIKKINKNGSESFSNTISDEQKNSSSNTF